MGRRVGDPPQETSAAPNLVHLKSQWEHGEWTKNISWDIIDITSHNYGFIYARISIIQLELHLLEDLPGHTWNHGISGQEYVFQLTGINRNLLYKVIPRDHVSEITDHYNIYIYVCVPWFMVWRTAPSCSSTLGSSTGDQEGGVQSWKGKSMRFIDSPLKAIHPYAKVLAMFAFDSYSQSKRSPRPLSRHRPCKTPFPFGTSFNKPWPN